MPPKKLRPGVRHAIDFAVSAAEQVLKNLIWQMLNGYLAGLRRNRIGLAGVVDQCRIAQANLPSGGEKAAAVISETINVALEVGRLIAFIRS